MLSTSEEEGEEKRGMQNTGVGKAKAVGRIAKRSHLRPARLRMPVSHSTSKKKHPNKINNYICLSLSIRGERKLTAVNNSNSHQSPRAAPNCTRKVRRDREHAQDGTTECSRRRDHALELLVYRAIAVAGHDLVVREGVSIGLNVKDE
ncbi:hypothetical protein CVT25_001871 [Psilocybe cyanescens]|uniref:Uncharacterized protein n=1 Tax=Psilocybe cyanescens TaxID=93625 RepID=A0A409WQT1_PSICY|nr:hypothetical protein CVT25_001871 [Psilocybe cyanescens]